MITKIEIEGFKSLEKVRLKLGKFNLFVGTNASGKSNFFDSLRVLQGIGYGLKVNEIFNGKPKGSGNEAWGGIRGGSPRARFIRRSAQKPDRGAVFFSVGLRPRGFPQMFSYSIDIATDYGVVKSESLVMDSRAVFERSGGKITVAADYELDTSDVVEPDSPALPFLDIELTLEEPELQGLKACLRTLSDMQRLAPKPDVLREYGQLFLAKRMGEIGENFPALVKAIIQQPESEAAYLSWLKKLTPAEVDKVEIHEGALGEPLFALREGGRTSLAPILSDGTLRFAALTAAFFQQDMPEIMTIEEIEDGIHPSRLRLLVELLKSQSGGEGPQVFATTHSPVVLAWLEESDYETTFFCRRDEETGASIIKPLSEIPRLVELVKKQSLGELFTEGWMETAS